MRFRPFAPLAALALLGACAGFMDERQLPFLPLADRSLVGEERIRADFRPFTLRRYAETRVGMGSVTAFYIVGPDPRHGPRRLANGLGLYSGTVNSRQFFSNFPGEWYCGQTRDACIRALEPEKLPPRRGELF